MVVDPLIIKSVAWLLAVLFTLLFATIGYFIKRTFSKQDSRNDRQDEINEKLQTSIEKLNVTMATVVEGFKWFQGGCDKRHSELGYKTRKAG